MFEASDGLYETPIELDDPLEAFEDFRAMLLTYVHRITNGATKS